MYMLQILSMIHLHSKPELKEQELIWLYSFSFFPTKKKGKFSSPTEQFPFFASHSRLGFSSVASVQFCLLRNLKFKKHISRGDERILIFGGASSFITSLVAQMVKCLSTMWETWVRSLGWEDSLEKEMATHSSTLA